MKRNLLNLIGPPNYLSPNGLFPSSLVPLFQNVEVRNLLYENDVDLHENEPAGGTHFQMNGFELRLVLKQGHKRTRKWAIVCVLTSSDSSCLAFNFLFLGPTCR